MSNNAHLAYGEEHHVVETVMRMHSVKRWHMIDTTRQQTLAEHSANVAMLAMAIVMTSPMHFFDDPMLVCAAALTHDVPECFTGDIPTHTKKHLEGLGELEYAVTPKVFNIGVGPKSEALIKLCDLADGIRFIRLHGVDLTARHAREGLEGQLQARLSQLDMWPDNVFKHVRKTIMFYAYENH